MRYGAGTIKWNKEELQGIDRKSRKIMTMNKELHHRRTGRGGARGSAAPTNFGQLRFFGQREKIWAEPVF